MSSGTPVKRGHGAGNVALDIEPRQSQHQWAKLGERPEHPAALNWPNIKVVTPDVNMLEES